MKQQLITYSLRQTDFTFAQDSDKWQVIFKKDGLDYCRESYPLSTDILKLQNIILKEIARHKLTSAEIKVF